MQDATQVLGNISYGQQLIPPGNYKGVIKELQEALSNNPIEIFYQPRNGQLPSIDIRFPSIGLPSGFAAIVYPHHVYKSRTTFGGPGHLWVSSLWLSRGPVISSHLYYHPEEKRQSNIDALKQEYDPANVVLNGIELKGQPILDGSKFEQLIDILSSAGFNPKSTSSTYANMQYSVGVPQITQAGLSFSKEGTRRRILHKVTLDLSYKDNSAYLAKHAEELDGLDSAFSDSLRISDGLRISISPNVSISSPTRRNKPTIMSAMTLHEPDLMTLEEMCALFKI